MKKAPSSYCGSLQAFLWSVAQSQEVLDLVVKYPDALRGSRHERIQAWPSRVYLFSRGLKRLLSGKTLQLQSITREPECPERPYRFQKKYQKCLGPSRGCPGSQVIQVYLFIQISVRQSQLSGLPGSQLSNSGKPFSIGTNQEMPGDGYLPNRSPWMPWIPLRIAAKVQVYLFSRHWKGIFCLL